MDKVLILKAELLVTLDEQKKSIELQIEELKDELKKALPNGTHSLGCAVLTIKDGSNSHLDKDAVCKFFNVDKDALEQFTKRSTFRQLSAKRVTIKVA